MAAQSFINEMQQTLGGVQQNSVLQQQSTQTNVTEANQQTSSNQATHSSSQRAVSPSLSVTVPEGKLQLPKTPSALQVVSSSAAVTPSQSPQNSQQPQTDAVVQAPQATATSQFITVSVSEHENQSENTVALQPAQSVHPTYVQYVEGNEEPNIYTTNNGQMAGYSVYSVTDSTAMYTSATATYYNAGNGTAVSFSQDDPRKVPDIISPFANDQCVIQTLHSSHDNSQLQLGSQQAQPPSQPQPSHHSQHQNVRDMDIIHVQWLIDNYETAEGVSLPRSTLYNHYLRHCSEHKLEPVNAASFGKLIRSVFLGLRTRRLGTRGNSKYHYYGIRVKPNSPLNQISDDGSSSSLRQHAYNQMKRFKSGMTSKSESNDGSSVSSNSPATCPTENTSLQQQPVSQHHQHQQYLGDASAAIPSFLDIDLHTLSLPEDISEDNIEVFKNLYREHCEAFLDAVVNLQFAMVENLWQSFWRTYSSNATGYMGEGKVLSKSKFFQLCNHEPILSLMRKSDYQFYQNLVDVLIPDVLRPIPSSLTQAIRNFAKSLEGWLASAMAGCPEEIIQMKVSAVSAFAQTLRRYTSLNHLAQAARAVLQNSSQISQMMADLNRVDFHNVQEQASWVCQCEEATVQQIEQDFKITLQQQNSLEQWASWLEGVVDLVLQPYDGKPDFPKAARQFLLKWSFYNSMVIRDLTLRSAASFGSFHLIRLLYDEYMFYLIEHRVAKAINETPIAVMGEFIGLGAKTPEIRNEVINQKSFIKCNIGSKDLHENGSLMESNCGVPQDTYGTGSSLTNGLKDTANLQGSLIGQPQVRFVSSMSNSADVENIPQHNKKLKSV